MVSTTATKSLQPGNGNRNPGGGRIPVTQSIGSSVDADKQTWNIETQLATEDADENVREKGTFRSR